MIATAVSAVLLLVGMELVARFALGLGSPLLYQSDDAMEYVPKPNQDLRRFGNRLYINGFSQRSKDVAERKTHPRELRVLLVGDSIVFGGSKSDQAETCGSVLESILRQRTGRPTTVLTIAAGSWGPANQAAYLRRFGTFDADLAVWVFPTGDWYDAPTFEPTVGVHPSYPSRRPALALSELLGRYVIPRLMRDVAPVDPGVEPTTQDLQTDPLAEGVRLLEAAGVDVFLFHWPTRAALAGNDEGQVLQSFVDAGIAEGATFEDLVEALRQRPGGGSELFRDGVHPNEAGNRWLAEQLADAVLLKLRHDTVPDPRKPVPGDGN